MEAQAINIDSPELFYSVPHYPVQIITPSLAVIIGGDDGEILSAGTMPHFRRVLRPQFESAAESKKYIHTLPRYMSIHFEQGLEQNQANPSDDQLVLNAAGLIKMAVIFGGKLSLFLQRGSMGHANACRFLEHVAGHIKQGTVPKGSVARWTHSQIKSDPALQFFLDAKVR